MDARPTSIETALKIASTIAERSRDPSTKVGCIILRPNNTFASAGYNGFPRGVADSDDRYADRETKYKFTCHAEANAIVTAREPLDGYHLICTHPPCCECAKLIIQAGIKKVTTPYPSTDMIKRWEGSWEITKTMFQEAAIDFKVIP